MKEIFFPCAHAYWSLLCWLDLTAPIPLGFCLFLFYFYLIEKKNQLKIILVATLELLQTEWQPLA